LERYAYQAWVERGKPIGSPEVDWETAKEMLRTHYSQSLKALDDAAVERLLVNAESLPGSDHQETTIIESHLVKRKATSRKPSRRARE
jgi:hypothetical protein